MSAMASKDKYFVPDVDGWLYNDINPIIDKSWFLRIIPSVMKEAIFVIAEKLKFPAGLLRQDIPMDKDAVELTKYAQDIGFKIVVESSNPGTNFKKVVQDLRKHGINPVGAVPVPNPADKGMILKQRYGDGVLAEDSSVAGFVGASTVGVLLKPQRYNRLGTLLSHLRQNEVAVGPGDRAKVILRRFMDTGRIDKSVH